MTTETSAHIQQRPEFVEKLAHAYNALLGRCAILTGNINDLFPLEVDGEINFVPLEPVLKHTLKKTKNDEDFIVLTLQSDGMHYDTKKGRAKLHALVGHLKEPVNLDYALLARDLEFVLEQIDEERIMSSVSLAIIDGLFKTVAKIRAAKIHVPPIALIIDHADFLFPNEGNSRLSSRDREALARFSDLLHDREIWPDVDTADVRTDFILLLSLNLSTVNDRLMKLPKTTHIDIKLPSLAIRRQYIQQKIERHPLQFDYQDEEDVIEAFAQDTMGLTIRTLDDLTTAAHRQNKPLQQDAVIEQVNQQLQRQLGSIVKLVYPSHSIEDVIGNAKLKKRLAHLKRRIDSPERAPAGITVVGPNGAGKTFIFEAFAANTGRAVITLSQIRSEWFGKTDVFAEQLESTLSAFGRILVLVDEAHAAFGSIHGTQTHETEARLTRQIIQMMDDHDKRGRILWVLLTTRPDLLDPDIVRSGRCSLFVPIFDPEGEDADAFYEWMIGKFTKENIMVDETNQEVLKAQTSIFSAGDYRRLIDDFIEEVSFNPDITLIDFLETWKPSAISIGKKRRFQMLLAAQRCDWRELLPQALKETPLEQIDQEVERLKIELSF